MKKNGLFIAIYLGLVYFMLISILCYQLGKTHQWDEAFSALWRMTQPLLPIWFLLAGIAFSGSSAKRNVK